MAERTLIFNGLSKAYAMTGWRLGYVAGPRPFLQQIEKVHSHSVTCATSFVQKAGVVALNGPQEFIGEMVSAWDRRRRNLAERLSAINGISCPLVEGAFYAFADIRGTGMSSTQAADLFLQEAHVAMTPGVAFGTAGEGHVRLSFATSDELLAAAADRIGQVLGAQTGLNFRQGRIKKEERRLWALSRPSESQVSSFLSRCSRLASYVRWVQTGNLLFISGTGPGDETQRGKLGSTMSVEEGYADAARGRATDPGYRESGAW